MAELQNGEMLREIYGMIKDVQGDIKAIKQEQENQNVSLDRHYEELEKLKWKVIPLVGVVTVGITILVALLKQ